MSVLSIAVIDTACQQSDNSFFPPSVVLSGVSTTTIGKMVGFNEYFGFVSNPPKKYRTLTWAGTSEQTLFNGAQQIAGAKYEYSGTTEVDSSGAVVSKYSKELSEMCTAADKMCIGLDDGGRPTPLVERAAYPIAGYIGITANPYTGAPIAPLCPLPGIPYSTQGNVAVGAGDAAKYDVGFGSGVVFSGPAGFTFVGFNPSWQVTDALTLVASGSGSQVITIVGIPRACGTLLGAQDLFPPNGSQMQATLNWNHDYGAILDDEFTEADALSVGATSVGAGTTAAYIRNGDTVLSTSVAWTLTFSNLVPNTAYNASYQLLGTSGVSVVNLSFSTGNGETTHTITGSIPAPASGQSTTIRNPTVAFA